MEKINEIKILKGVNRIAVKQHDDKIVIEFIPEEPKFKRGDILISIATPGLTVIFDKMTSTTAFDSIYHNNRASKHYWNLERFRHATKEEEQEFFDELEADGKRWNAEKLEIEDISQYKFKAGDKVRIKEGILSKTHKEVGPGFSRMMDEFIGEELTVKKYSDCGFVILDEDYYEFWFNEDWIEPWSEEPKVGDMVIAWNNHMILAVIGIKIDVNPAQGCKHVLNNNNSYKHAIKFESKEQFEKVLRGEIN